MVEIAPYEDSKLSRDEIDAFDDAIVLDFGTDWCGHCNAAAALIAAAIRNHPGLRHIKIEDGPGRRLGRSFGVKLWPTVVLVRKGQELARRVRPVSQEEVEQALKALATTS